MVFLIAFSWLSFFDQRTVDFIDSSLLQSLAAFATAKGLNGVIGVLESTDITLFGSASFDIGKILAPAKELIDQFAEIMEYAIGSLMLQKLLITISSSTFFKLLLTVFGAIFLVFHLFRHKYREFYQHYDLVYKSFVTLLFARFFFLLVFGLTSALDSAFIANTTTEKIASIEGTPGEVDPTGQISAEEQEERRKLNAELKNVSEQLGEQQTKLLNIKDQIDAENQSIDSFEPQITELKEQLSFTERLTGSSDDSAAQKRLDQLKQLQTQQDEHEQARDQLQDQQEEVSEQIGLLSEQISDLEDAIENFGKDTLAMMRSLGVDFIKSARDKLETAADTALELTVLFIFKSVLLPLLFIFAGYKLFIQLWHYDVRQLRHTNWRDIAGDSSKEDKPVLPAS